MLTTLLSTHLKVKDRFEDVCVKITFTRLYRVIVLALKFQKAFFMPHEDDDVSRRTKGTRHSTMV